MNTLQRSRLAFFMLALLTLAGCSVKKQWFANGGSRSNGTVELAVTWALFEVPIVDAAQGYALASAKCANWGFTNAEAFGGTNTRCNAVDYQGSCIGWIATATYQCVGAPSMQVLAPENPDFGV